MGEKDGQKFIAELDRPGLGRGDTLLLALWPNQYSKKKIEEAGEASEAAIDFMPEINSLWKYIWEGVHNVIVVEINCVDERGDDDLLYVKINYTDPFGNLAGNSSGWLVLPSELFHEEQDNLLNGDDDDLLDSDDDAFIAAPHAPVAAPAVVAAAPKVANDPSIDMDDDDLDGLLGSNEDNDDDDAGKDDVKLFLYDVFDHYRKSGGNSKSQADRGRRLVMTTDFATAMLHLRYVRTFVFSSLFKIIQL